MSDFWVFGYGSLMWRPGFDHLEAAPARLNGAHRSLCVYSWFHRGTKERPGLVLGLDRGGSCRGVAYRVAGKKRGPVIAYLRERELVTNVYREAWRPVALIGGKAKTVPALAYLVDRSHVQYAGRLAPEKLLELVKASEGKSGANAEYVLNTVRHLRALGIRDRVLEQVAEALSRLDSPSGGKKKRHC
ncbi:MAG: gamma-glutamylcyclotransferase [Bauldia sp.]|nr:gamma-glutamylcyclotransferase [Bauldia sp.]